MCNLVDQERPDKFMKRKSPDFISTLKYRTAEEGGRTMPAHSGYRPQIKFGFEKMQTSGQQVFIGKDIVQPGETVTAEITMVSSHIFQGRISCGMCFEFREGAIVIGTGEIIEILNGDLNILAKEKI
jgi:elongation factor Tu